MPIQVGDTAVTGVAVGGTPVTAVYVGGTQVWSRTQISFDFNTVVTPDLTSLGFVHYGPDTTYKAISDGASCRINYPDGYIWPIVGQHVDRIRYDTVTADGDNGWLRFKFNSLGSSPTPAVTHYATDVFARGVNNDDDYGVGVRAEVGTVKILTRIAGVDTVRVECGTFDTNDEFRLRFVGRLFTLYRNGEFAGEWEDAGNETSMGSGYRSLLLRLTAGRELFAERRFSPWLDLVEYR